jgi:hypothetical protein
MEFRDLDYNNDIDEVVILIQKYLQPKFTKKTLIWKHINGAFGKSHSKVAVEEGKIVGVVFSMRYNYKNNEGDIIKGIRTFDGCTDENQRGKGVFKKLMKMNLDSYGDDYDFLMANPNTASFPEHIKLGYEEPSHNYYYKIGIINPFHKSKNSLDPYIANTVLKNNVLCAQDYYLVGNTEEFIHWRYLDKAYTIKAYLINEKVNYVIYRLEMIKGLKTIILCDYYGNDNSINSVLREVCKTEKTLLIYYLDNKINGKIKFLFKTKHRKALIVFKNNKLNLPENMLISLGDLEGIL